LRVRANVSRKEAIRKKLRIKNQKLRSTNGAVFFAFLLFNF